MRFAINRHELAVRRSIHDRFVAGKTLFPPSIPAPLSSPIQAVNDRFRSVRRCSICANRTDFLD